MANISKITARWTGFAGGPGYSNFYFGLLGTTTLTQAAANAVRAMFQGLVGYLPNNLTISFDGIAQSLDDESGVLMGAGSYTPPTAVTGTNTTAYSGLSGASIRWLTGTVVDGKVLTGRTFLVPLVGVYDTDGTLAPAFVTTLSGLANTLAHYVAYDTEGAPMVWHRPQGAAGTTKTGGSTAAMTGASVADRAVVLRSRRG